ncbi:MAG: hypothetical protein GY940_12840, partial [bacterium]|nr:hypothetical protein [bacterium]
MKEKSKPKPDNTANPPKTKPPATEPPPDPAGEEKKKKTQKRGYGYTVHQIRVSLDNSDKPGTFADYLLKYGFDASRLAEGRGLLDKTDSSRVNQLNAIAEKNQSYRVIKDLKVTARAGHRHIRVLGKEAFRDNPELLEKLGLSGTVEQVYNDWESQALRLHNNLTIPGVMETFADHNVTAEELTAAKDAITAVHTAITERNRLKAEAEKATQLKNDAYKVLLTWWYEFKKIVNIALKNDPQLKEQIY